MSETKAPPKTAVPRVAHSADVFFAQSYQHSPHRVCGETREQLGSLGTFQLPLYSTNHGAVHARITRSEGLPDRLSDPVGAIFVAEAHAHQRG
eukprot:scaffold13_cov241-Pinguiococcus_pyrenoidosus.AAC.25